MEIMVNENPSVPKSGTGAHGHPPDVTLRHFQPGDEVAFRRLNEAWIAKYFVIEDADREVLGDRVDSILEPGGHIFLAVSGEQVVGCCALVVVAPGAFELAKMAVLEQERGRGIGRKLLEYTIAEARRLAADRLYLETNRKLENAIHLYESVGFRHVPPDHATTSAYARANVFMEMSL